MCKYSDGEGDPCSPIPLPENAALDARYEELADRKPEVHFVGRLATYMYLNLDQVVAQVLVTYRKISGAERIVHTGALVASEQVSGTS